MSHWADKVIADIIGAFKVFLISVFVVYFALEIIDALPNVDLPITTNSKYFISFVMSLLFALVGYIKSKNKQFMRRGAI